MPTVLGVSASLRNARFGRGSLGLCKDVRSLGSLEELRAYLTRQVRIRVEDFLEAGRREGLPFSEVYRNLRRLTDERGLSNSEAALAAGLWGAHLAGAEISHCGLAAHFPASGRRKDLDGLRAKLLSADAILLSGPVYFGDRGSLAQEFIEFLREDEACAIHVRGKLYGGIAVGAKRNGGQETTLIYQLVDMTNMNMLAVGNDSETTSQYGGTAVAGDVGTLDADTEGIMTSIGTGRRLAQIADLFARGRANPLERPVRVGVWLLQDHASGTGRRLLEQLRASLASRVPGVHVDIQDFTRDDVYRCLACDVCPVDPGPRESYRCIVTASDDLFAARHQQLINADAVLLAAYSPVDRSEVRSVYQRFVERTRYLRRDDYVLANQLTAPLVISQVNSNQNLHIRMLTSFVRQLTVLHHPLIGVEFEGRVINWDFLVSQAECFARAAATLAAGCQAAEAAGDAPEHSYHPIGYIVSAEKSARDRAAGRTRRLIETDRGANRPA
jgi:multimeric flavodoxin WrbA